MAPSSTNKLLFDVKTEAIELVCKHIGRTTSHTDIGARHTIENAASARVVKVDADGLQSRRHDTWLPQPAIAGLIAHRCIVIKVTAQSPAPDIIEPHNPLPEHKVYDRARHFSCIRLTRPVFGPNHEDNGCAGLWASSVFERGSDKASRVRVEVMSLKAYEDVRAQGDVPTDGPERLLSGRQQAAIRRASFRTNRRALTHWNDGAGPSRLYADGRQTR